MKIHSTSDRARVLATYEWSMAQAALGHLQESLNWDPRSKWHNSHFLDPEGGRSWVVYLPDHAWSGEVRVLTDTTPKLTSNPQAISRPERPCLEKSLSKVNSSMVLPAPTRSFLEYVHQQGVLVRVLEVLTQRNSYVYNEEGCWFPDADDPEPFFRFEGVKFGLVDESAMIVITEEECWQCIRTFVTTATGISPGDANTILKMLARVDK